MYYFLLHQGFALSQTHDLNYYLGEGTINSPLIKEYSSQLQRLRIDSLLILAGRKIAVTASGQIMIAPIIDGYGYDEAITNQGQYTAIAGIRKPILQKNYYTAQLNRGRVRNDSLFSRSILSRREVEKAITDQYLNTYDTLSQIKFQEQTINSLENQLKLLAPLVKSGIYLQTDYLTLQLQIQTEKITDQLLHDGYRSGIYTLNALCGIPDTTIIEIDKPDLRWKASSSAMNPILYLFSLDSSSIEGSKNLLHYNYVPRLNLFGDAGYQAIPADASFKKFGFSAGITMDWNIYDGGQRNLKLQQLTIQQLSISAYRRYYSLQQSLQFINLDKKFQSINSIIIQWQDQLNNMNQLMAMRRQQLFSGQLSAIDYLAALRDYSGLGQKLNNALMEQQRIISEHNYLVW
ncbi:MAG: TolC family protein [Chitinophagales bacterium]